jgi:hypothetical protein
MEIADAKDRSGVSRVVVVVALVARNAVRISNVREDMIAMRCRLRQSYGESSTIEVVFSHSGNTARSFLRSPPLNSRHWSSNAYRYARLYEATNFLVTIHV